MKTACAVLLISMGLFGCFGSSPVLAPLGPVPTIIDFVGNWIDTDNGLSLNIKQVGEAKALVQIVDPSLSFKDVAHGAVDDLGILNIDFTSTSNNGNAQGTMKKTSRDRGNLVILQKNEEMKVYNLTRKESEDFIDSTFELYFP